MAGTWMNLGLDYIAGVSITTDCLTWVVKLYQNNYTPVVTSATGDLTVSTYPGYANQTPGTWTTAAAAAGVKNFTSALMNFVSSASSAQSIYGYGVYSASGVLLFAEKFTGGPYTIPSAGAGVQLTAVMPLSAV